MTNEIDTFARMARDFPLRTAIFTFGPLAFAVFQLLNGLVNGGTLPLIAAFAVALVGYSVWLTRYQVAVYRRKAVTPRWAPSE